MSSILINAIAQLKEIEDAMKLDPSNFKNDDIDNCDKLAIFLHELESEVKRVNNELETETIRTNVFRDRISYLNVDIKNELKENINAARDSNAAVIMALKERLEILTNTIQELQAKDKELTTAITSMESEKKDLEVNHENIIIKLNDCMAEKAKAQIQLNETRDILREKNQNIMSLEEEIIDLNEKLVHEKAEAREEKFRLEEEKYRTNLSASNQEDFNREKSREVAGVKNKLQETNKILRTVFRENERLEQQNEKLNFDIENGSASLVAEQKELESLVIESLRLTALEAQVQQEYSQNKEDLIKKTKQTSEQSKLEAENLRKLKETEEAKRVELKEIYDIYNELQRYIHSLKSAIDEMKSETGSRLQEMADLEAKGLMLTQELSRTQNIHIQVMDSLQREAEEYKEQIIYERELRQKKQQQRDAQLLEIEEFNGTVSVFQTMVSNFLNEHRTGQRELKEKESILNERLEMNRKEISNLEMNINTAVDNFDRIKEDYENKLKILNTLIIENKSRNESVLEEIRTLTPGYEELCENLAQVEKDFDQVKLKYISTKSYKIRLESNIQELKDETKEHETSRATVRSELNSTRQESLSFMKIRSQELIELENKILHVGLRLHTLKQENEKFINAIKEFEIQFKDIEQSNFDQIDDQDRLREQYEKLQMKLIQGWREDFEIQKKFTVDDQKIINELDELLNLANSRENQVGQVTSNLSTGINLMNQYIGKLNNKKVHFSEKYTSKEIENSANNSNLKDILPDQ